MSDGAELRELELGVHAAERNNDLEAAARGVERLTQRYSHHAATYLARAKLRYRRSDHAGALEDLDQMMGKPGARARRQDGDYLRGKLLDRQGRCAEAFAAFTSANGASLRADPRLPARNRALVARIGAMGERFSPNYCSRWAGALAGAPFTVVWHVGFPRSGTTLLDQMLASHPQVTVLEERDTLGLIVSLLERLPGGYPACLRDMDDGTAEKFRAIYLSQLASHTGGLEPGRVYVDKMPMNTIHLGLAARVLPDVRVLFSLRNPMDVCLSCFMQPLRLNPFNSCFLQLDDAVALYGATMDLYRHYEQALAVPRLTVRYESLIADLEGVAREVTGFLGLPFDPCVLAFHEHARRHRMSTNSYDQVVQPLYDQAVDRWHRYEEQLAPWAGALAPYCEYFSYDRPTSAH